MRVARADLGVEQRRGSLGRPVEVDGLARQRPRGARRASSSSASTRRRVRARSARSDRRGRSVTRVSVRARGASETMVDVGLGHDERLQQLVRGHRGERPRVGVVPLALELLLERRDCELAAPRSRRASRASEISSVRRGARRSRIPAFRPALACRMSTSELSSPSSLSDSRMSRSLLSVPEHSRRPFRSLPA